MKKKNVLVVILMFFVLGLTACMQPTQTVITDIFELESNLTKTVEEVEGSCIAVLTLDPSGATIGTGSGVIYKQEKLDSTNKYYVVTNNHVVESGVSFKIHRKQLIFTNEYDATLIGIDSENDLAVLTFETTAELDVSVLENVDILKKGQFVLAIGTPIDLIYYNTVNFGIISNFTGPYIQHDAPINPGNSGGALFNQSGRLIGINVAKKADVNTSSGTIAVEGIGFAIPISTVIKSVATMEESGTVIKRPVLGVTVTSFAGYRLNYGELEDFDDSFIPSDMAEGIIVVQITPNSVAHNAGFMVKDIITKFNNVEISTNEHLRIELWKYSVGDEVSITIIRDMKEVTLTVTL